MTEAPLLKIENLTTSFHTEHGLLPAVEHVNLTVQPREIVAVVGESGSGKTVTCLSIIDLVAGKKMFEINGSILFEGRELVGADENTMRCLRGNEIGMIFQEPMTSLNPVLTVGKQIDESLKTHTNMTRRQRRKRIVELLHLVGIPEPEKRVNCYPFELSGGMKQRVMIAMALCCNPKLLIADEPTTALDVTIQAQILMLLKELRDRLGMSIIFVSHDLGVVSNFAERVVVMYAGKVVEEGSVCQVIDSPLHPYTYGLIESIPRLNQPKDVELHVIPGNIPDLSNMPAGCRFAPRCPRARPECAQRVPEMREIEAGHSVCCLLFDEKGGKA
ncbi:MAG: ABC transporter ATP-binding protein [Clostridia bacterium]|nr:ABC transporter ATP-binding protein [Clostridia bacterium]